MSKRIARVVFSVLIALVLVAGVYSSVQGAMLQAGTKNGQSHVDLSLRQYRTSVSGFDSFDTQDGTYDKSGHDCGSDSSIDPDG